MNRSSDKRPIRRRPPTGSHTPSGNIDSLQNVGPGLVSRIPRTLCSIQVRYCRCGMMEQPLTNIKVATKPGVNGSITRVQPFSGEVDCRKGSLSVRLTKNCDKWGLHFALPRINLCVGVITAPGTRPLRELRCLLLLHATSTCEIALHSASAPSLDSPSSNHVLAIPRRPHVLAR